MGGGTRVHTVERYCLMPSMVLGTIAVTRAPLQEWGLFVTHENERLSDPLSPKLVT